MSIVPFLDVVVNLLVFLMMAMGAVGAFSEVHAQLPSHGPPGEEARWRPTVVLTERGAFVSDGAGTYAAGCEAHAPGEATGSSTVSSSVPSSVSSSVLSTVPNVAGALDASGLRLCASRLAAAHPHAERVTLTADPAVPLADLVAAMDALRGTTTRPLFPEIQLAAGVR
ncbi:MAG TPA: biopolymer transporter ExbD [Polyangiaceae bacterium LLY-WYZ-15_(1-7)]|nr:biopolymer transporter ExbD [Polyangiaceae bacterium LLY-WYZ-15_(1-7)]